MKISFYDYGDPSVGMMGGSTTFDLDEVDFADGGFDGYREEIRKAAENLFQVIQGERVSGQFDDECGDCNQQMVLVNGDFECHTERCMSNTDFDFGAELEAERKAAEEYWKGNKNA